MKQKKVDLKKSHNIWNDTLVKISKEESGYYYEIKNETTIDVAEFISLLMRLKNRWNDEIWNLELPEINYYNIQPSRCLYWLSGGDEEWIKNNNYKKSWFECSLEFQERFGLTVVSALKKSTTYKDVRDNFIKYLKLANLYEFALEMGIA